MTDTKPDEAEDHLTDALDDKTPSKMKAGDDQPAEDETEED